VGDQLSATAPGEAFHEVTHAIERSFADSDAWDLADGTGETREPNHVRFTHTFPRPGTYRVPASVTDNLGTTFRWVQRVAVDKPLSVSVDQKSKAGKAVLTARAVGGRRGHVLAAHWTFADGTTAEGTTVTAPAGAGHASVTIVDGAGNTATVDVPLG